MFDSKDKEVFAQILQLAKEGDENAIFFLQKKYNLKVYTPKEIERINFLMSSQGLPLEQAINQMKGE